jgi:hypothetical protein
MFSPLLLKVNPPRIIYVATADHLYTLANHPAALAARGVRVSLWSWDRLLSQRSLPRATYILTDFDRLSPTALEIGGRIHRRLVADGVRVLNDPRRFRDRAQLISALQAKGLIDYGCTHPATGHWPVRYPVFLRTIASHRGMLTGLIEDRAGAEAALTEAIGKGFPISDLLFVDYCAAPMADTGHFQKHAALRVGKALVRANTVNDTSWAAKNGVANLATPEHYAAERAEYDHWPHHDYVARVFDVAGMDFGRLDFGDVNGRPQAYEINTNPTLKVALNHANPDRRVTMTRYRDGILDALAAVATRPKGPPVPVGNVFGFAPRAAFRRPRIY